VKQTLARAVTVAPIRSSDDIVSLSQVLYTKGFNFDLKRALWSHRLHPAKVELPPHPFHRMALWPKALDTLSVPTSVSPSLSSESVFKATEQGMSKIELFGIAHLGSFNPNDLESFSASGAAHFTKTWASLKAHLIERGFLSSSAATLAWTSSMPRDAPSLRQSIANEFPQLKAELELMEACAMDLPNVLRGDVSALELLFKKCDDGRALAEVYYTNNPPAKILNAKVGEFVRDLVQQRPRSSKLRVLEIGAGTGGTTASVLPHLAGRDVEYVFTDLSELFLRKAQLRFENSSARMVYHILDITGDLQEQGCDLASFDLIIAANVLHATPNMSVTMSNVRNLLAPHGSLVLLELTRTTFFLDLTFGLTPGWWFFEDADLRPSCALMSGATWERLLASQHFTDISEVSYPHSDAAIFVAKAPATVAPSESLPDSVDMASPLVVLKEVLAAVVNLPQNSISVDADLSSYGMDSLMAIEFQNRVHSRLNGAIRITQRLLKESRTLRSLASALDASISTPPASLVVEVPTVSTAANIGSIEVIQASGDRTPLVLIHDGSGTIAQYLGLKSLIKNRPVYAIAPKPGVRVSSFAQFTHNYIDLVRSKVPQGPYVLGGWSLGGLIALDMARSLSEVGVEVEHVLLIDSFNTNSLPKTQITVADHARLKLTQEMKYRMDETIDLLQRQVQGEYHGRVTLIRARALGGLWAGNGMAEWIAECQRDPFRGFSPLLPCLEVVGLKSEATHLNLFSRTHVDDTSSVIAACLDSALKSKMLDSRLSLAERNRQLSLARGDDYLGSLLASVSKKKSLKPVAQPSRRSLSEGEN